MVMPAEEARSYQFEYEIRSQNPNVNPTQSMIAAVEKSVAELGVGLEAEYGKVELRISQKQTFPFDPVSITITVLVFVGTQVAGGAATELGKDIYTWLKKRLPLASVESKPKQ